MSQEQHLHHVVAERLRTIATLIGSPASAPLEIDGQAVIPGLGLLNPEAQLRRRADRLQKGHLLIAAIGAVCRGKSTLLNACLGREVFPSGPEAVTGGICRVVYGDNPEAVTLVEKGGGTRPMNRAAFNAFISLSSDEQPPIDSKDAFQFPERLENLHQAVLHSDSPLCELGISFVDTLGFNAGPEQELITQRFLRQTDAILVVLRTAPLFDEQDAKVINTYYQETASGIGNMFFVANDFGGISDEEKRVLMEKTAPAWLRNFFTGADGEFDRALFDRRVFLVNAKAALDAQLAGATGDALEATGLPALERAFHRVLDEGEHLHIATDAAVAGTLLPSLAEAHTTILRQRGRLDADAEAFEKAVHEAEARFVELTHKAHALRTTIERHGQRIAAKAARHFENTFVRRFIKPSRRAKPPWYADWDSLKFGELLRWKNVTHAAIAKGKRGALAAEIQERLQGYIRQRLEAWGEEVPTHLQPDIDKFIAKTEAEVEDFVLQLDEIQESIADRKLSDEFVDMDKRRGLKAAQMILGLGMLDANSVTGTALETGGKLLIRNLIRDIVVAATVLNIFGILAGILGMPFLVIPSLAPLLAVRLWVQKKDHRFMVNRVRDKIGTELHKAFSEKGPEFAKEIRTKLEQQFTPIAENLQLTLDTEIAAVKQSWDAAAETRREGQAKVDKEIARLETIDTLLTAQFEAVSTAVYGRVLTSEEQKALVERFTFAKDEDDTQEQRLHHAVAERFRAIATLIGTPASVPLEIDGQAVVPGLGLLNAEAQLLERADRLQQGHLLITAIGAVSRGKSTLLNACLGKEVFPTGPAATTGGICRVIYGGNPEAVTLVEKGGSTRTLNRAEFNAFISLSSDEQQTIDSEDAFQFPERLENLHQAVLHSDSPLCERGISFVDTLGFNAGPEQELITQRFLRQTDAILVVLRTAPLFDESDAKVINTYYQEFEGIGNMFFVINDFGMLYEEEKRVLMEKTAPARLRNFFTDADGAFDQALFDRRVFLVDAKAALDAQRAGATGDALEATGLPALERAFHRVLDEGEHLRIATDAAVARTLLPSLDEARIAIQRRQWDAAVETGRAEQAAVGKEITRLETIETLLTAQFEAVSTAIYGRVLTSEEQKALVERFTFSEDEDDA